LRHIAKLNKKGKKRETERLRDSVTERHRDRGTDRENDRGTEGQRDRETVTVFAYLTI
jgi:hypothetical protein